jgi:hypothetical protein
MFRIRGSLHDFEVRAAWLTHALLMFIAAGSLGEDDVRAVWLAPAIC